MDGARTQRLPGAGDQAETTLQRILVTGGAGFVGSHLVDRLLDAGHDVVVLDDLSTGSRQNIAHLVAHPRFRFVHHDVTQPIDARLKVDRIYHLACPASPVHYQADPIKTTLTCVDGTFHVLEHARRVGARVLYSSTSEVYGDPEVHPQPESYRGAVSTIGPRACYDEGKRCAESLVMDFRRQHGVAVRLARIFNTYGPRMAFEDGRVVSNFVVQALRGEDLTIYGDGSQTRSFCYVDDLVDGLMRLMEHPTEVGPINLGNPEEFTVVELARLVLELTRASGRLVSRKLPADDPRQRRPDIGKAREILGYQPRVPLREGLIQTIAAFRRRMRRSSSSVAALTGTG